MVSWSLGEPISTNEVYLTFPLVGVPFPLLLILSIVESSGESKMKSCNVMINVMLLGAYSDMKLQIWYGMSSRTIYDL